MTISDLLQSKERANLAKLVSDSSNCCYDFYSALIRIAFAHLMGILQAKAHAILWRGGPQGRDPNLSFA
jgi:hypothetical protein